MNDHSSLPTFTLEVREDGVAVVRMDVPGEPVNTLKASFADGLPSSVFLPFAPLGS